VARQVDGHGSGGSVSNAGLLNAAFGRGTLFLCAHACSGSRDHRLNNGGDRQTNSALWRIVIVRMRVDPRTRDYVARRTAEGLARRRSPGASSATPPTRRTANRSPLRTETAPPCSRLFRRVR
jgi:hypothetical protein